MKRLFLKAVTVFTAFIFTAVYYSSVVVNAAAVINLQNVVTTEEIDEYKSVSGLSGITKVSNLQLINLEEPKAGDILDNRATVLADGGYFWEIPVVWVDEEGNISYICLPGKTYRPVLAFFVPKNVEIVSNEGESGFSLKLPEFLEDIFQRDKTLFIASENYGLTFIVPTELAYLYSTESQESEALPINNTSIIVANSEISKFFYDDFTNTVHNFNDYAPVTSWSEHTELDANDEAEYISADNGYSEDQSSEPASEAGGNIIPFVKDLVALHCSSRIIDIYGQENLNSLLHLVVDVIEPQAVLQLNSGFNAYSTGAKNGAIGKEIGLYVYSSQYVEDTNKDIGGAVAYVDGRYLDESDFSVYGYYIGINVESLYSRDLETNEYVFRQDELVNLNNTVVHELMHAYMDDYNRTGMMGVYSDGEGDNEFPLWFVEGIATTVENAYVYHSDLFDKMMDSNASDEENRYTVDSLLNYYNSTSIKASINANKHYYDGYNNRASAYVSGYLATMYLADMANYKYEGTSAKNVTEDGYYYDSSAIRNGLNIILKALHEGVSLNEIINRISDDKYSDTTDFQNRFLNDINGVKDDESINFCVDLLNYLDFVTTSVVSEVEDVERANGSILLPFDTTKTSPIDINRTNVPKQNIFVINDSKDYVESTVSNELAIQTGGKRTTGDGSEPQSIIDQNAAKPSIEESSLEEDESTNIELNEESDAGLAKEEDQKQTPKTEEAPELNEEPEPAQEPEDVQEPKEIQEPEDVQEPKEIQEPEEVQEPEPAISQEEPEKSPEDIQAQEPLQSTEEIPSQEPLQSTEEIPVQEPAQPQEEVTTPAPAPEPDPQPDPQPESQPEPDITPLKVETPIAEVSPED